MRLKLTRRLTMAIGRVSSSQVMLQLALHGEEIEEDADQDDEQHHRGDGRTHGRAAGLELIAEEGAIEEGAENVGRVIRPGLRALHRIDQVEGVEVADEGQD